MLSEEEVRNMGDKEKREFFDKTSSDLEVRLKDGMQWYEARGGLDTKLLTEAGDYLSMIVTKSLGPLEKMVQVMSDECGALYAAELAFLLGYKKGFEDKNLESMLADTKQK
jgi:hypothetical protein